MFRFSFYQFQIELRHHPMHFYIHGCLHTCFTEPGDDYLSARNMVETSMQAREML